MQNVVPSLLAPAPVLAAQAKVDDLTTALSQAHQQVEALTGEHRRTVIADQKAFGAAVLANPDADPPKRKADAVEVRLNDAKARTFALADALQHAQQAVEQARHDHCAQWLQNLLDAEQQGVQEALDAARKCIDTWTGLWNLRGVKDYLEREARRYKPFLPLLRTPSGDPISPPDLLRLLTGSISPAPPVPRAARYVESVEPDPDGGYGATIRRFTPVTADGTPIVTVPTVYPDSDDAA